MPLNERKDLMEKMVRFMVKWAAVLVAVLSVGACSETEEIYPKVNRTVLLYLAGDNNLNRYAYTNINSLCEGMKGVSGQVVVYLDPAGSVPCLMVVQGGSNPTIDTLEFYEEEDSADPATLQRVIAETKRRFPSDSYGLILWSHGQGWHPMPSNFSGAMSFRRVGTPYILTKWFGQDETLPEGGGDSYMEVEELMEGITGHWDFIMFDACFMASVEVLYELRDKADYFVASPAEIITDGFPYADAARYFWGGENDLKQVCRAYYNYYANHQGVEAFRSATLSLVKASELGALAQAAHEAVGMAGEEGVGDVWRYPLIGSPLPDVFYDLGDYVNVMGTEEGKAAFREQLARTVVYKVATDEFGDENRRPIPTDRYSGLSCYIPQSRWPAMNEYYSTLGWAQTVYGY